MFCTSCGSQAAANARFCPACGASVDSASGKAGGKVAGLGSDATLTGADPGIEGATIAPAAPGPWTPPAGKIPSSVPPQRSAKSLRHGGLTSSDPISGGRFAPGQILAERYRIVALAGRGGMGEVYRAEDLRLSQVVAIKFLPEELSQDASALARFHSEVRIARQVSHPNVCRVFDIGDVAGVPFLSMEYVDGEDLASVVRRIGRLSPERATEVARQICAGMAAAHEKGVIHRDLKPANVMLDGAGKIRIMDFGLAGIAAAIQGSEIRAGTPAYMAPEQLEGREVTVKSDIYALGLIIYEILTGKRAFEASSVPELVKLREQGTLTNPSAFVKDLDPLIERVTLRCLAKDPALRPASALQVAAALPGGDPLAAALAAGETPSPEMVAAAGNTEGMNPRLAMGLLATVVIGLLMYMFMADRVRVQNMVPLDKPPEVLLARSQEILQKLGYTETPADTAYGFITQGDYLDYIQDHDKSQQRWKQIADDRPATMLFWYRQSPREMQPLNFFSSQGAGLVTTDDPFKSVTGMTTIMLDPAGRLIYFTRIPPERDLPPSSPMPAPDWTPLLAAAGIEQADAKKTDVEKNPLTPVTPEWTPLMFVDTRGAWTRTIANPPDTMERLEAAAYRGRPVFFNVLYPWQKPARDKSSQGTTHELVAAFILVGIFTVIIITSIVIMRRNRRLKRGDDVGSQRLGAFVMLAVMLSWILRAHHLASINEWNLFLLALAWALTVSSLARVLYFALEPFVRRRDPHALIAWARLIGGKICDPLVGRDALIGVAYGVVLAIFESTDNFLLPLLHLAPPMPNVASGETLLGVRPVLGSIFFFTWVFVLYSLLIFFLVFLVRIAVRKDWIVAPIIVFLGAITNTGAEYFWENFIFSAVIWASIYLVLRRFGLLALVVGLVVQNMLVLFPMTSHLTRWYASGAVAGMLVILGIAIFAFYNALAGKAIFAHDALDD
jgi:Protein kinase domain/zinc-ribbon domain